MTESEWFASTDAVSLFRWIAASTSQRKYRLYLCGGCHSIEHLFFSPSSVEAVEVAERLADGLAEDNEVRRVKWEAEAPTFGFDFQEEFWQEHPEYAGEVLPRLVQMGALSESVLSGGPWQVNESIRDRLVAAAVIAERCIMNKWANEGWLFHCLRAVEWPGRWLVDCVFGNPFCPVTLDAGWLAWNGGTVPKLAHSVYEGRRFGDMPILADALEDAGCSDQVVLTHCRSQGEHVRGCWVLDLLLGK